MLYIITTKDPRNPGHNPHSKVTGGCTRADMCTDSTGEHHSFLLETSVSPEEIKEALAPMHVTRIESVTKVVWSI